MHSVTRQKNEFFFSHGTRAANNQPKTKMEEQINSIHHDKHHENKKEKEGEGEEGEIPTRPIALIDQVFYGSPSEV